MATSPSLEQAEIIHALMEGNNVLTDSVAGSGKTTTILFTALADPNKRILSVTYNSRLKAETRQRVKQNSIENLEVHSYHSLGLAYYTRPCLNDIHLGNIVRNKMIPYGNLAADILILDECQDMTKTYYDFIRKVIKDMNNANLQLFVMGDHLQCIYDYAQVGADSRFLTLADKIFPSNRPWIKKYLRTSYRITKPMEWFVNECMLGYPRLVSMKETPVPVKYITGDAFYKVPEFLGRELQGLFREGYKPMDVFVLAPSIRSHNPWNPVKRFENLLVRMGIPCFVPLSDDEELKDEVINGKVVFSSIHQSKGLERKIVIVANFSSSLYYVFKDASRDVCPNISYVSATRASQRLYLWGEGEKDQPLPFLNEASMMPNQHFQRIQIGPPKLHSLESFVPDDTPEKDVLRRVTDLTRFLPEEAMSQIIELCQMVVRKQATKSISIASTVDTTGSKKENVSDLNGIAIPTIYEHKKMGKISIQMDLQTYFMDTLRTGSKLTQEQKGWISIIQKELETPAEYLKLANIYSAYTSGYLYKIAQIQDYNWLTKGQVDQLLQVLESFVVGKPEDMLFEHTLEFGGYEFHKYNVTIAGRADLIDDEHLWEVKCVDTFKPEHFVQLALYAWLWQTTEYSEKGKRKFCLVNLRTGEIQELLGIQNLGYILDICLDNAFRQKKNLSDEEFVKQCLAGPGVQAPVKQRRTSESCMILDD
jgi:hypothetical protein